MNELLSTGRLQLNRGGSHLISAETSLGELFYLSSTTGFPPAQAIRGGVPVIAPWFADILGLSPKHGWARTKPWEVQVTDSGAESTLSVDGITLTYRATELPDGVRVELSAHNDSAHSQTVQLAFHPYFLVSDVEQVTLSGLADVEALDRVSGDYFTQSGLVNISGEYDRIFLETHSTCLVDHGLGRSITITAQGADSTVVWNPGEQAAASMADIGSGEWSNFLCVEPALLGPAHQGVSIAAGETRRLVMEVTVNAIEAN
ncbi:D-hexose-6-phosphate mutarotase [Corynebacterium alimapuense]|uniref:glucose-6-phosphate 1-epimerase n=1 Tax=Corynebacterium alimapuense TaxID=1576874 RepID=A0A3M8KAN9_9CORY|nr:D-hexose-6-phosphate mutarotase [Corynebacterium alimapuense]RNE49614.1 D-hexose-6-phosphate mutarotase [Corynebacterium alimapuense]